MFVISDWEVIKGGVLNINDGGGVKGFRNSGIIRGDDDGGVDNARWFGNNGGNCIFNLGEGGGDIRRECGGCGNDDIGSGDIGESGDGVGESGDGVGESGGGGGDGRGGVDENNWVCGIGKFNRFGRGGGVGGDENIIFSVSSLDGDTRRVSFFSSIVSTECVFVVADILVISLVSELT